MRPLSRREQSVLDTLYSMHREFPEAADFEVAAVELLTGPAAGSIGVLASAGFVHRDVMGPAATCRLTMAGRYTAEQRRKMARSARATFESRQARR